jgi:hypothetical protein
VIRLLAGEITTWRRRREIVVASLAVLVIVAGLWISGYLSSQAAAASLPANPGRAVAELAFLAPYRSPASIVWIVASGIWLFFGVYYLGAATTGGDFVWATIRTALLAGRGRISFVAARLAFIVVLGWILLAVELLLGVLLPVLLATGTGRPVRVTGVLLAIAAGGLGVGLYGSAGVCVALLLRDRAAPLLAGAAAVVGQSIGSSLPFWQGNEVLAWVPRLFPSNALGALFLRSEQSVGILPKSDVVTYLQIPWPVAVLIVIAWIAVFTAVAVVALYRADITA